MKSNYQDPKQLEQLIRSTKADFAPSEGLLNKVKAALAAAPAPASARKSVFRQARKLVHAFTLIAARQPVTDGKGHALQLGDRLPAGCKVMTGEKGRVSLITRGGSELTLNSNSKLALAKNGKEATLSRGELYCRNRAHEFAAILTAAGRIELLGTTVDANMKDKQTVAVTVVEGKVRLENAHGEAIVDSGKKSLLMAQLPPEGGETVNTTTETAWYDSRESIVSESGQIAYMIQRDMDGLVAEIWMMDKDGKNKHRLRDYAGYGSTPGPWLPGDQAVVIKTYFPIMSVPDLKKRRAHTNSGGCMFEPWEKNWLLDLNTGQDTAFSVPSEFIFANRSSMSPDATRMAFGGGRKTGPERKDYEAGLWVLNLQTHQTSKLLEGGWDFPRWSPNGKTIAASQMWSSSVGSKLVFVNLENGAINDPGIRGTDAAFSPDGSKIAYVDDYQGDYGDNWHSAYIGRVYVRDVAAGGVAQLVSPKYERCRGPRWSPDGTRLLYTVVHTKDLGGGNYDQSFEVFIAAADGSWMKQIYQGKGWLEQAAWRPGGEAIYISDTLAGISLVAADGSGVLAVLGGTKEDSTLSSAEQKQSDAAQAAIQEAVFQYVVGRIRDYEGKFAEAKKAYLAAADIFAGLPWEYPLLNFSPNDVIVYADKLNEFTRRDPSAIADDICKSHLDQLGFLLPWYSKEHDLNYPANLAALTPWAKTKICIVDSMWRIADADTMAAMVKCPEGDDFIYTPTAPGKRPKAGDVILQCPRHPEHKIAWEENNGKLHLNSLSALRSISNFGPVDEPSAQ